MRGSGQFRSLLPHLSDKKKIKMLKNCFICFLSSLSREICLYWCVNISAHYGAFPLSRIRVLPQQHREELKFNSLLSWRSLFASVDQKRCFFNSNLQFHSYWKHLTFIGPRPNFHIYSSNYNLIQIQQTR